MNKRRIIISALMLIVMILAIGCSSSGVAKNGDTVQVNYVGKLSDGTIFDSTQGASPLQFVIGDNSVIPGFEKAVIGMKIGGTKTVVIPYSEAYGPYDSSLVGVVSKKQISDNTTPTVGMQLTATQPDGSTVSVTIIAISGDNITLDGNHPLAGKDLTFTIQLMNIL